jgi:hypothetical protein
MQSQARSLVGQRDYASARVVLDRLEVNPLQYLKKNGLDDSKFAVRNHKNMHR